MKIFVVFVFIVRCNAFFDNLTGPYFLWSSENLDNFKLPALQAIDEQNLREIYSKFSKIKIFIRNKTTIVNKKNFPKFSQIIDKSENWIYLPQQFLTIYPDAKNVEIFKLFGSMTEQDEKILEIFEDAQNKFGDKKVLGILATQKDMNKRTKREVEPNYLVYAVPGKILFYLYSPPELEIFDENGKYSKHLLDKYLSISVDQKKTFQQLFVNYQITNEKITLGFNFEVSSGNWKMTKIFYEDYKSNSSILNAYKNAPSAPFGNFSFACNEKIIFKNENISLTLKGVQIQPFLHSNDLIFGTAHDCIGFTSPGILAGLFVTGILLSILAIGITAIMNIHVPDRFDNRKSKQFYQNVQ